MTQCKSNLIKDIALHCRPDAVPVYSRDVLREAAHECAQQDPSILLHRTYIILPANTN